MMRHFVVIAVVGSLGAACKSTSSSRVQADFADTRPTGDQSWTDARTISLDKYAADLLRYDGNEANKLNELQLQLNDSFKAARVVNPEALSVYTIKLGPSGECFSDGDYDLWWNSHRDAIKKQVEEVAYFVRDVHYKMLGRSGGPFGFREVVICPEKTVGTKMLLDGYKLYIGVPYGYTNYDVIPNRAAAGTTSLDSLWQSGAPLGLEAADKRWFSQVRTLFSREDQAKTAMRVMWRLFNPLSPVRQSLRKTLHENGTTLAEQLRRLSPIEAEGMLTAGGDTENALLNSAMLGNDVRTAYAAMTDEQRAAVTRNLACFGADSAERAAIEQDAVAVMQREIRSESNSINKDVVAGLVAVVNHHRVGVNLQAVAGPYRKYIGVERATRETNITTRVRAGLVAVDTSDDISVDLGFSLDVGKSVATAGFDRSVRAAQAGRSLCN